MFGTCILFVVFAHLALLLLCWWFWWFLACFFYIVYLKNKTKLKKKIVTCILLVVLTHLALLLLGRATPGFHALFSTLKLSYFCIKTIKTLTLKHKIYFAPNIKNYRPKYQYPELPLHKRSKMYSIVAKNIRNNLLCPKHKSQNLHFPNYRNMNSSFPTRSAIRIWVFRCCAASRIWHVNVLLTPQKDTLKDGCFNINFEMLFQHGPISFFCLDFITSCCGCTTDFRLGKHVWTKGNCRDGLLLSEIAHYSSKYYRQ